MAKDYRATVAAIRTVYGKRLSAADYRDLLNLHSLPEIVAFLKDTERYGELLRGLDPAFTHRGYLEMLLQRDPFIQCLHFCKLEQLHKQPFFRFFIYDREIRELVKAIRLLPDAPQGYISAMDTWVAPYLDISLDAIARAADAEQLIAALAHTPYAPVLKKQLQPDGTLPYTASEIALRVCYLNRLREDAKKAFKPDEIAVLQNLVGEQIDLINIINAYRMKSVFHADEETLHPMLLPISGKLPARFCEELYTAPDAAQFLAALRNTRYGRKLPELSETEESVRIEHAFQTLRCRTAKNALHFSDNAAVSLYALHVLNEAEVRNLITVIEGIRYGKPVPYLESLLILP